MRYTEAGRGSFEDCGEIRICRCFKPWFMLLSYCDNMLLGMLSKNVRV